MTVKPQSPCIRECMLDPETDVCLGCYRTIAEIMAWPQSSDEERRRILEKAEERRRGTA
jgi:predicted Fe-S protein YdhL (DUF1289 family)